MHHVDEPAEARRDEFAEGHQVMLVVAVIARAIGAQSQQAVGVRRGPSLTGTPNSRLLSVRANLCKRARKSGGRLREHRQSRFRAWRSGRPGLGQHVVVPRQRVAPCRALNFFPAGRCPATAAPRSARRQDGPGHWSKAEAGRHQHRRNAQRQPAPARRQHPGWPRTAPPASLCRRRRRAAHSRPAGRHAHSRRRSMGSR